MLLVILLISNCGIINIKTKSEKYKEMGKTELAEEASATKKYEDKEDVQEEAITLDPELIFYEPFNFSEGRLQGKKNPNSGLESAWNSGPVNIQQDAGLTYPGIGGKGAGAISENTGNNEWHFGIVPLPIDEPLNKDTYFSVLVKRGNDGGTPLFRFYNTDNSSEKVIEFGINDVGRPYGKSWVKGEWIDTISTAGTIKSDTTETHLLCAKFEFDSKEKKDYIKVWLNPDGIPKEPADAMHEVSFDLNEIINMLQFSSGYNQNQTAIIDEIRMGHSWKAVLPGLKKGMISDKPKLAYREYDTSLEIPCLMMDISKYFDNDGIVQAENKEDGDFDGKGNVYAADFLPPSGKKIALQSIPFLFPDYSKGKKNNMTVKAQKINVPEGSFSAIHFLCSASKKNQKGNLKLIYKANDAETVEFGLTDWTKEAQYNDVSVIPATFQYNSKTGKKIKAKSNIFLKTIDIPAYKILKSIELPDLKGAHIFAISLQKTDITETKIVAAEIK